MVVKEGCKGVNWETQGMKYNTDFLVLTLMGCDLVLGVHWLRELGLITWDFSKLTMEFTVRNQSRILQGMFVGAIQIATKKQASKMASSSRQPCSLLMTFITTVSELTQQEAIQNLPRDLQRLLIHFQTIFDTSKGLPPLGNMITRLHLWMRHKLLNSSPIDILPYRRMKSKE